jgi:DNA-binding response OmpR family regulator
MKLLVVDDDTDVLRMISRLLKHRGHVVHTCSSPFGVSAAIMREGPDLVLLDVMMPGLSGTTLAGIIAGLKLSTPPRVALWSAMDDSQLRQAGRDAGLPVISKGKPPSAIVTELERLFAEPKS